MKRRTLIAIGIVLLLAILVVGLNREIRRRFDGPTDSALPSGISQPEQTEVLAQELVVPWETALLPDGDVLVTERAGTLRRIGRNQQTFAIEGVQQTGEGGLMGLALHPDFADNARLYLYLTSGSEGALVNRIEAYTYRDDRLSDRRIILDNIPGAANHDGGRLAFGPDGKLYITTGDAQQPNLAQDTASLAGKILRLNDDGTLPADNPFSNAVYSYGHRNPQGLAWDDQGRLWSVEHGPSGMETGHDELNLITKGANYGWPAIRGDETREGMVAPVAQSGKSETWAPAGMAFHNGSLFFAGLRGESLYQAVIQDDSSVRLRVHLRGTYGRLRGVAVAGNRLYLTTSNRDGRGQPETGDDKAIILDPTIFKE